MLPSGLTPETTAATTPEARARDKINRDLFWLKDDSLLLSDDLSDSDPIAAEITRDLRSLLERLQRILVDLESAEAA